MKKVLVGLFSVVFSAGAFAQLGNLSNSTKPVHEQEVPVDGYYENLDIENRKVIPYAPIRQTDVAFKKRVWREIDLRERINRAYASPLSNLMTIIVDALQKGELTAYDSTPSEEDPSGDSFKHVLSVEQAMMRLGGDSVLVEEYNENNEVISSRWETRKFDYTQVVKFRIKEDWIFDKQRSIFEPRIIGIAPLITPQIPGMDTDIGLPANSEGGVDGIPVGNTADPFDPFAVQPLPSTENAARRNEIDPVGGIRIDATPAFWIYFPEARHVLVNKEVKNRNNGATGLSFDDVFIKRIFSSYIVKEENPDDVRIKDYIADERERLYESERIKKSLMDWEQDLWSY